MDELHDRFDAVGDQLWDLGIAFLQLIFVVAAAVLIARWVRRRLRRRAAASPSPALSVVVENSAAVGVYIVAFTVVLALWGLTWTGLVTALSISTVAVAFGFQDLLRSVVGGVLVMFERPFALGDRIKIREIEGKVERIDLRTTIVRADSGDRISIPNALMFSDPVTNRSPNRVSRVLIVTGIEGSPSEVKQRAVDALAGTPGMDGAPQIQVRTKRNRRRIRTAIDAVPGIERIYNSDHQYGGARATGLRIVWSGTGGARTHTEIKRRLLSVFPAARISNGNW